MCEQYVYGTLALLTNVFMVDLWFIYRRVDQYVFGMFAMLSNVCMTWWTGPVDQYVYGTNIYVDNGVNALVR